MKHDTPALIVNPEKIEISIQQSLPIIHEYEKAFKEYPGNPNDPSGGSWSRATGEEDFPHPSRTAASPEEIETARTCLVSLAASRVRYFDAKSEAPRQKEHATLWCEQQSAALAVLDATFAPLLPLTRWGARTHNGEKPTAVQCAKEQKASLETLVLATVYCPAWRIAWIQSFLMLIIKNYANTRLLILQAVKGGSNTDCEIRFVEEAMRLLGFTPGDFRTSRKHNMHVKIWMWQMKRPATKEKYTILMYQYDAVKQLKPKSFAYDCRVEESKSIAPDLKRVAIISMPLQDINEDTHEKYENRIRPQTLSTAQAQVLSFSPLLSVSPFRRSSSHRPRFIRPASRLLLLEQVQQAHHGWDRSGSRKRGPEWLGA